MNQIYRFAQINSSSFRWSLIGLIMFTTVFYTVVYTFLHEAGHALVGMAFGQTFTNFNINFWNLSAHVSLAGELSPSQSNILYGAGAGLPLLVWVIFISLTPRKVNFHLHMLRLLASISILSTIVVWIILPLFRLFRNAYPADDVTQFLRTSQMHPLLLSSWAIVVFAAGWALFRARAGSLKAQLLPFRQVNQTSLTAGTHISIPIMTMVMVLCLVITFAADHLAISENVALFTPPDGYKLIAEIELDTHNPEETLVTQFSLVEPKNVGVFYRVEKINTSYLDLRLEGPDSRAIIILHGEDWQANRTTGMMQENFPSGDYKLLLTASQSPGKLFIYFGNP